MTALCTRRSLGPALLLVLPVLGGCFGTPSPLAPALSGSVGMPHNGVQTAPQELPVAGDGFVRYRPHGPNYWGNPRLVRAIESAAAAVARQMPGGAPLVVGDLSARRGGKILGHRSHRNGRDVDLLWYVTTPGGAPLKSPGFVPVESDGLAKVHGAETAEYVRLDLEREWFLVKKLLTTADIGIQFMFVSRNVEALLIDYARSRGEDIELIWQAETVLLQPADSTPHNDHVHVRIACSPEEAVAGCEGGGPLWEWLPAELRLGPLDGENLDQIAADDPLDLDTTLANKSDQPGGGA